MAAGLVVEAARAHAQASQPAVQVLRISYLLYLVSSQSEDNNVVLLGFRCLVKFSLFKSNF